MGKQCGQKSQGDLSRMREPKEVHGSIVTEFKYHNTHRGDDSYRGRRLIGVVWNVPVILLMALFWTTWSCLVRKE